MISQRTILSLCQYLDLQVEATVDILLEKHGFKFTPRSGPLIQWIRFSLAQGRPEQIEGLLEEIVRTNGDLESKICGWPHDRDEAYRQRWQDLLRCLELDGYRVEEDRLVPIDPTVHGASANVEDDLSRELSNSGLADTEAIKQAISTAVEAFRRVPPDHNACLTNARVALETLVKAIALHRQTTHPGTFNAASFGQTLAYLRTSGFLTEKDEGAISGAYGFVSQGAHAPIGVDQAEMARLGLHLAVTMCMFLVKAYNHSR